MPMIHKDINCKIENNLEPEPELDAEKEVRDYMNKNNLQPVAIEDEEEWNETMDFLISLNDTNEKLLMQNKCRKVKFMSRDELEKRIVWFENNVNES